MGNNEEPRFHRKSTGGKKVQIGPRIDEILHTRLRILALNLKITLEQLIENALFEFMEGKDLTPVVQTTLPLEIDTNYNDPRYAKLKILLGTGRNTTANERGRLKLIERISKEYADLGKRVPIDSQLAVEVTSVLEMLQGGIPKLMEE